MSMGILQDGRAQTVREYAPADSLSVGDTFDFSITLDRNRDYDEIIFPDSSHFTTPDVEIRSRSQFKVSEFRDSVHYQLQFFGTSDTTLSGLPILLIQDNDTTVLYTNPVPVAFRSVLAGDQETFRPLKPIFEFARAWLPYILAFLLLCLAAYYLYGYFTKKEDQPPDEPVIFTPVPFANPLKTLQQNIGRLENAELAGHAHFKQFYIDLGDAIRQYFEYLHQIPALESTSREIIQGRVTRSTDSEFNDATPSVRPEADI